MDRILITSAIPYINGIKHLGNLVGSQLPSDLFARYMRLRGHEVMFICATDEHGTPAEIAAKDAGKDVATYCQEMYHVQKELAERFHLSFDHFGRSSSQRNHALTQYFAGRLEENGYITEVIEKQIYSKADQRYLPDRYVRGECPSCGYVNARGDQCENCTKQLDPTDLINPYSAISGSTDLEIRKTKHLYLRQSLFRKKLEEWIDSKNDWPILTTSIAKKWLFDDAGLQDRGITRDLDWGIPVRKGTEPWPGMEQKVFYVWFDAPIEYIAATAEWADTNNLTDEAWERWWRTDKGAEDVRYIQFMGKDNVPFHTLSFPVTIMGSNDPWKLVDYIKSFNFLNYDGGQFSTSLGRGIFMDQALDILPADYWRWWLLSHAPEHSDSEFTWENFMESINNDLANVLGNFVSRVTQFSRKHFGQTIPLNHGWTELELNTIKRLKTNLEEYENCLEQIEIRKAAQILRRIWSYGNEYIQEAAPWVKLKSDQERASTIMNFSLNLINFYGIVSEPYIPETAKLMRGIFKSSSSLNWPHDIEHCLKSLDPLILVEMPPILFKKITPAECENWKSQFSGQSNQSHDT
ncbi:MAG: methionine--tRNA ligase [Rhodobacteraceae bacterium]|nr:methionine--tRNA ligase [Paracoccaceae bacterium]